MPAHSKPLALVKGHRTKAEKEVREKAEKELLTGHKMREWKQVKEDACAHSFYIRISKLFKQIGKNDALHENVLNRYCILLSECERAEKEDARLHALVAKLEDKQSEMEFTDYIKAATDISKTIAANDKNLQLKRKMLLDIEKENIMTLASQLRSVPKKPIEDGEDPMSEFFKRRGVDA